MASLARSAFTSLNQSARVAAARNVLGMSPVPGALYPPYFRIPTPGSKRSLATKTSAFINACGAAQGMQELLI